MRVKTIITSFLDLLFPPRCAQCRIPTSNEDYRALCNACAKDVALHTSLFCGRCRARLPARKKICHKDVPFLLGAATEYACDPIRALIHDLKFRSRREAAEPLASFLAQYLTLLGFPFSSSTQHHFSPRESGAGFTVVPLPLSGERERARGFNQSLLIAQGLAHHLRLPLRTDVLLRTKHALPQTAQESFAERYANVRDCFEARVTLSKTPLLLVDDVITSGATLSEASKTLKRAGAGSIIALTVARA